MYREASATAPPSCGVFFLQGHGLTTSFLTPEYTECSERQSLRCLRHPACQCLEEVVVWSCASLTFMSLLWVLASDDGTGPEKIAHIMGPPDRCEHAARIINDLLQSLRVGGAGWARRPVGAGGTSPASCMHSPPPPCLAEWSPRPSGGSWHAPWGPRPRKGPRQLGPSWRGDDLLHPHSQVWAGHWPR